MVLSLCSNACHAAVISNVEMCLNARKPFLRVKKSQPLGKKIFASASVYKILQILTIYDLLAVIFFLKLFCPCSLFK